jgi:hypothetical protein
MARKRRDGYGLSVGSIPTNKGKAHKSEGKRVRASVDEGEGESARERVRRGADGRTATDGNGRGMGGAPPPQATGRPPARGPLTQRSRTKAHLQSLIGSVVFNESGRGVWGRGEVVAVIPPGVSPYYFCKQNGLRQLFRKDTCVLWASRFIVLGDDGKLHAPERVVWQMR